MQMIFWTEDTFCFTSDCRKSFNCKLKKLLIDQIIIFHSPSNALRSSDESVQIKHFNHHTFIGMNVFLFHLVQSANTEFLLMKTQRVLNRWNKWAIVRYCKNQVFLLFTINSKSKLKKFSTLFSRHLPSKTRYEIQKSFMVGSFRRRSL